MVIYGIIPVPIIGPVKVDSRILDYSSNCFCPGSDFKLSPNRGLGLRDISGQMGVIGSSRSSITTGMWTQLEAYWGGAHIWEVSTNIAALNPCRRKLVVSLSREMQCRSQNATILVIPRIC